MPQDGIPCVILTEGGPAGGHPSTLKIDGVLSARNVIEHAIQVAKQRQSFVDFSFEGVEQQVCWTSNVDTILALHEHCRDHRKPLESGDHNSPDHEFKNFHRLLCERFDYSHDEVDWKRDQISLIEWIAKRNEEVASQRDNLLKAITLIAAQSLGDDWTVEQAYAFVKQHAREARDAVRTEISAGSQAN
jgi:hypothetical protein